MIDVNSDDRYGHKLQGRQVQQFDLADARQPDHAGLLEDAERARDGLDGQA
nr:hypothetical protein [Devosia beringensis]